MEFTISGKVALITGGASGLGYHIAKELLKHGLKGIAIVDIDGEKGEAVQNEFNKEFIQSVSIFIKTDVAQESQLEEAFKVTVETFKQLDIVINNAGVLSETNWKKCLDVNLGGCLAGTILAIDTYLPKHKSGPEGVIINIASILGLEAVGNSTVAYTASKHGVVSLAKSYGVKQHYERTKVRILTICPGTTRTPMTLKLKPEDFKQEYSQSGSSALPDLPEQEPEFVAESLIDILKEGQNGSVWVVEGGEPAYEVEFLERFNMRKK